VTQVRTYI